MATASSSSQNLSKEYLVRVPKLAKKRYHMMRFNAEHGGDFFKNWSQCRMEREGLKSRQGINEEMPKFGAGSEYGREAREEARRKRYGINIRKDKITNQPWRLNIGGKGGKRFRGVREGGVAENAAWFVFMQGKDGSFEAYPIDEWYNFSTVKKYNSLSAEDAEKEFERRDKIMNFFQVMYEKKLRGKDQADPDEEDAPKKGGKKKKKKDLVLSELDDWMSDDEEKEDDDDDDGGDSDDDRKKKKKGGGRKKKQGDKRERKPDGGGGSDDSCIEESDDYDEAQEQDYISGDSSDSDHISEEVVNKELAGIDADEAIKKFLNSDEESSEDEEKKEEEEGKEGEGAEKKKEGETGEGGEKKKKKKKKKDRKHEKQNPDKEGNKSSSSKEQKNKEEGDEKKTVNELKRKAKENPQDMAPLSKKLKPDPTMGGGGGPSNLGNSDNGVTEDSIRRYLMRKPMTTTELLQKFKSKKTGLSSEQLVQSIAQILKRVNPVKQMVQGKMYLSIKTVAS